MRAHLAFDPPFAFFAQIDLTEAAALGQIAAELPSDGRLLFFYDLAVGPWESGTRVARVIWDRAARETLTSRAMPYDLAAAAEEERRATAEAFAKRGLQPPSREGGTIYGAPARSVTLAARFQLPAPHSLDLAALPDISTRAPTDMSVKETALYSDYCEVLEEHGGSNGADCHLLGLPMPVQDDPRYDAVVVATLGKQHLTREEWAQHRETVSAGAHDWVLLLQVDLKEWTRAPFTEGTVYFLIRRSDLATRTFEEVVAVYQQS